MILYTPVMVRHGFSTWRYWIILKNQLSNSCEYYIEDITVQVLLSATV